MGETKDRNIANEQKYKLLRDRWDKEDSLLISRTGIFLTTNSILFAALGFQEQNPGFQAVVAVIGFLLSILWLTTSWHTFNVIKKLYRMSKDDMPYELIEIYRVKPILFRPNTVYKNNPSPNHHWLDSHHALDFGILNFPNHRWELETNKIEFTIPRPSSGSVRV